MTICKMTIILKKLLYLNFKIWRKETNGAGDQRWRQDNIKGWGPGGGCPKGEVIFFVKKLSTENFVRKEKLKKKIHNFSSLCFLRKDDDVTGWMEESERWYKSNERVARMSKIWLFWMRSFLYSPLWDQSNQVGRGWHEKSCP